MFTKRLRFWISNIFILCCVAALLTACAAVTSVPLNDSAKGINGIPYSVPMALLPISITIDESKKSITFASIQPQYKPDLRHNYRLYSPYSAFHKEELILDVTGQLINSAKLTSISKLDEIIVEASKYFAEGSYAASISGSVFSKQIEVGNLSESDENLNDLNRAIQRSIVGYVKHASSHKTPSFLAGHIRHKIIDIDIEKLYEIDQNTELGQATAEDCKVGVCYRIAAPYRISVRFFDGTQHEEIVYLPNDTPVYALAIKRGVFSDWTTEANFVNGMPTTLTRNTTSEIETIVGLPTKIIAAQIATLTQAVNLNTGREKLIKSDKKLQEVIRAESALRATPLFSFNNGTLNNTTTGTGATPGIPAVNGGQTNPSSDGSG